MLRFEHLSGVTAWLSGGFDCGGYMLGESDAAAAWAGLRRGLIPEALGGHRSYRRFESRT